MSTPGNFLVRATPCESCIYQCRDPKFLKRLERQVSDGNGGFRTYRSCHHHASGFVCCRGFWNRHKNEFRLGQIAQMLDVVKEVRDV